MIPSDKDFNVKIATLRHEATRYNELCAFYPRFKEKRLQLNELCAKVLRDEITVDEFFSSVEQIERDVDLRDDRNQSAFLAGEKKRISRSICGLHKKVVEEMARRNLRALLNRQESQMQQKRRGI